MRVCPGEPLCSARPPLWHSWKNTLLLPTGSNQQPVKGKTTNMHIFKHTVQHIKYEDHCFPQSSAVLLWLKCDKAWQVWHGLTVAVSLSQSEMKALNPSPNTAPAVLPGTKHNYHTDCLHCASHTHCRPLGFLFNSYLELREILEDNMPVILRIKESGKSFCPHFIDSRTVCLCSAAFRRICSLIRSAFSRSTWARALASASTRSRSFLCLSSISCSTVAGRKRNRY